MRVGGKKGSSKGDKGEEKKESVGAGSAGGGKQEEKEARLDALLAGKYEMRQGRKMMAQDFQVQKQILAREVEEMN